MTETALPVLYAGDTAAATTLKLTTRTGDLSAVARVDLLLLDRTLAADIEIVDQPADGRSLTASWRNDGSLAPGEHVVWARVYVGGRSWTSVPMRLYVEPSPGGS